MSVQLQSSVPQLLTEERLPKRQDPPNDKPNNPADSSIKSQPSHAAKEAAIEQEKCAEEAKPGTTGSPDIFILLIVLNAGCRFVCVLML